MKLIFLKLNRFVLIKMRLTKFRILATLLIGLNVLIFQNCGGQFTVANQDSDNASQVLDAPYPDDVPIDSNAALSVYARSMVTPQGQDFTFKFQ